jgi:ribosomal protein S18 acetylase RimI-like enzyme
MPAIEYTTYSPGLLPAIVRFWNAEFADRRNFFPVSGDLLTRRIFRKETAVEKFDPEQFLVAVSGGEIAGILHYIVRGEELARAFRPDWPGGTQGAIAFFCVARKFRRQSIGRQLFATALDALRDAAQVVIDTQCHNPFYGNSTGPRTPFWGHTEGIGIDIGDLATAGFLNALGFTMTNTAHSLIVDFADLNMPAREMKFPPGYSLEALVNEQPRIGGERGDKVWHDSDCRFMCIACMNEGRIAGAVTFYEMSEVAEGKGAIYHLEVAREHRKLGIGRILVAAALAEMLKHKWKSCETLTIPMLSPGAVTVYRSFGFHQSARWALY